jgi:hypothetical protein
VGYGAISGTGKQHETEKQPYNTNQQPHPLSSALSSIILINVEPLTFLLVRSFVNWYTFLCASVFSKPRK